MAQEEFGERMIADSVHKGLCPPRFSNTANSEILGATDNSNQNHFSAA